MIVRKTSHAIEIVVNVSTHAHSEQLVGLMLSAELWITIHDVSAQNVSLEDLIWDANGIADAQQTQQ